MSNFSSLSRSSLLRFSPLRQFLFTLSEAVKAFFEQDHKETFERHFTIKRLPGVDILTEFLLTPADNEDLRRNRRPRRPRGLGHGHRQPEHRPGKSRPL